MIELVIFEHLEIPSGGHLRQSAVCHLIGTIFIPLEFLRFIILIILDEI